MPKFTLDNSFRFGSRRETITNFQSESIGKILKKLTKDWMGQFAREEQIHADLIGWQKMFVKINEVLDDAVERQRKEESVTKWLGKLRNLACDVDFLLDEFQTEAFQRMLLQDDDVMSKVKEVNATLQDIASQIDPLDLRKKSGGKSRNVRRAILSAVRLGGGGRDPPGLAFTRIKIFSKSELVKATKNFHHCLGKGGFGSVYKGVLPDDTQIAVKKYLCADKSRITEWEFLGIISQVNHRNVVKILGLCIETKVPLLVYEFVCNGTVFEHIHYESSQLLKTWKTCLRIAAEIASALEYLHSLSSSPIIHGDVKSANILLDDNYTAKVADFESSMLISSDDETAMTTKVVGTIGYLDPEYMYTGILTKKSDVYSFGVVLVELLSGMNPCSLMGLPSDEEISMVAYFLYSIKHNSLPQILKIQVADESEMEEIEIVAELASKCLRIRGTERPTMKEVSEELDRLRRLQENYWAQKNNEETEHLLGESSTYATAVIAQSDTQTVVSIDTDNYYESERGIHCSTEKKMPEFTLHNSFHFGSQKQTISDLPTETIETLLKKMTSDRLWQFAHEEQIQDDLIGWKKMLVKINEVLDDAMDKQMKEESVKMWLGKLQNLACDVDYLFDEFQTEAFQKKLLLDDDAMDKFDSMAMSKVKDVNARFQDIASHIDLLGLKESSVEKSRNARQIVPTTPTQILDAQRGGGRYTGPAIFSPPLIKKAEDLVFLHQQVQIFTKSELVQATKNYDTSHFLGEGGFSSVYKGVLPDHTQVAVKKPKAVDKIPINQVFQHELRIVSQINHKNVVKIIGACLETKVPLLVYEFVSNGTLFDRIHDKSSQVLRNWKTCLRIAAETASALDYLHSLASLPIIHGDVKSTNILLDDNYTAKVADFGSSVLISSDDQSAKTTKIIGTFFNLDPEYLITGKLTEKSDVYSFGVVLAELLTGLKPGSGMALASNEEISMVQYFLYSIENNSLRQILNFQVADESEMEEIETVAELASKCLSLSGRRRPTMNQVSEELDRLKLNYNKL